MRRGSVAHEKEGKVIHPVETTFVGSTGHVLEGGVEAFDGTNTFVVKT